MRAQLVSGTQLDRYRLERILGTGAFGAVWLAVDEGDHGFKKRVALKVMSREATTESIGLLMREARISAAMRHPHIVDCYGAMELPEACFIVMEYIEGETLASLWRDLEFIGTPFPRSVIVDVAIAVCEALHHAWSAKDTNGEALHTVHRDLKPANVMLSLQGEVKVADFGIAKVVNEASLTLTGKVKGTPAYLAPELWTGQRSFVPAVDLWSLGVILWEMCTLRRFYGRAAIGKIFDITRKRLPKDEAEEIRGHFPGLVPLIERLLQRQPDLRPQSALEVAEELRALRHGLPPSGDLVQFIRLIRAGRLDPEQRFGSLMDLPTLPKESIDWTPLVQVANSVLGATEAEPAPRTSTDASKMGPPKPEPDSTGDVSRGSDTQHKGGANPTSKTVSTPQRTATVAPSAEGSEATSGENRNGSDRRLIPVVVVILMLAVLLLLLDRLEIL